MIQTKQSETNSRSNLLYGNTYYVRNLEIVKNEAQPNKWDCLAIFHGFEGSGKSTLMFQTAVFFDKNFSLENVVFTPEEFNKAIDNAPVGSCIVWDEAITGANAQQHAKSINQAVISKLTQIRKKRLVFLLGFPYLWMLSKYFVSRSLFSCHVYAKDFDDRGYFNFYDFKKTNTLYWYMKKVFPDFPMSAIRYIRKNFAGKFNAKLPFDENEYDNKKEQARINNPDEKSDKEKKIEQVMRARQIPVTIENLAYIFDVSVTTINNYIHQGKQLYQRGNA